MATHTKLTPSASIREQYYKKHGIKQRSIDKKTTTTNITNTTTTTSSHPPQLDYPLKDEGEDDDNVFEYRPEGAIAFAPLKLPDFPTLNSDDMSLFSLHTEYETDDDATRSIISLQTMDSLRVGGTTTAHTNNNDSNISSTSTSPHPPSSFAKHHQHSLFNPYNTITPHAVLQTSPSSSTSISNHTPLRRKQSTQTLFASSSHLEPTIIVSDSSSINQQQHGKKTKEKKSSDKTSLLSRLSKTTAPMRARLSAMSRSSSYLKSEVVSSISIPLRRSAESVYNFPTSTALRITGHRSHGERAQSFSFEKSIRPSKEISTSNSTSSATSTSSNLKDSTPLVYPALLSEVAVAFKERVTTGTKIKDGIKYKDTFDGVEAVDKLIFLIKSKDRNLALLLGRALDAQKFFHDVNYEHRLRDSRNELYRFTERVSMWQSRSPFTVDLDSPIVGNDDDDGSVFNFAKIQEEQKKDGNQPNGVFTILTNCYSPTCTREKLCYSVFCPRRLEQQAHSSSSQKTIHRTSSKSSLNEKQDRLWATTVPKYIVNKLSKEDRKRQENIFELIYTERDFVDDLAYVDKHWIQPLLSTDIIQPPERRQQVVKDIFWNIMEVYEANNNFAKALEKRQKLNPVVDQVGDIILEYVAHFTPFVQYGAHQIYGKSVFETEKTTNPEFADFVQTTERLPVSRKLELNGYLTKPTTRLGRYNLLLREILKHTPKDHPDQETIPRAMKVISEHLTDVNHETGKTENKFNLQVLSEKLQGSSQILNMQLDLLAEERQIIMKGPLKRKGTGSESLALQVYLLDHYLIITKSKFVNDVEHFKLVKKPIPIQLLAISLPDQTKRSSVILPYGQHNAHCATDSITSLDLSALISSSPNNNNNNNSNNNNNNNNNTNNNNNNNNNNNTTKSGYPISFVHLGRNGSATTTLFASTFTSRRQWVDKIESYRYSITEKQKVFEVVPINNEFFNGFNKVNCAAVFGESILIGSDQGVYLLTNSKQNKKVQRLLSMDKVSQIDILENKFILVLADKTLYTYAMDSLLRQDHLYANNSNTNENSGSNKILMDEPMIMDMNESSTNNNGSSSHGGGRRGRKISSHVSFFKVGKVMDRSTSDGQPMEKSLVCYVRYNAMTSTIRALEVHDTDAAKQKKKRQQSIRRKTKQLGTLLGKHHESLKVFKDLYIPGEATSIQYFKNVLCVGSAKGFQMVDVGSAGVQSVLDPTDESHNALSSKYDLKPISMFRHPNGNILLCYNDLAFYIDKKGRRARNDWLIQWEGHPTAFAFRYPYIVAFDSSFIEIRHIDTGHLVQVVPGNNIRCLKPDPLDVIHCVMEDGVSGNELVFQLKFLEK